MHSQSQNQFVPTSLIGSTTGLANPNTVSVQPNPSSSQLTFPAGTAVKLITGASNEILVDAVTGPTDGPVFAVIQSKHQKSTTLPGFTREASARLNEINLLSGAAIARGDKVAYFAPTYVGGVQATDPLVKTAVATNYVLGVALDRATAAGQIIRVLVDPSYNVLA